MGVLFAAFLRVPLTSVFMVLEVSGNYSIILPVILANTIAYLVSRSLQPSAIFEVFTHQDGLDLPSMEEQREEVVLHLEDALRPLGVPVVESSASVREALQQVEAAHADVFLVRVPTHAWYSMTMAELGALAAATVPECALSSVLKPDRIPLLFPDLPLDSALPHLARWPILPVQNRASRGAIEGTVTLADVLSRYQAH
jgi:chloride channel protein, CIC family